MAAVAPAAGKGKRKRQLSEDDVYLLLHRYAPGTILTALQEVAQHAEGRRIDWKAVVGKSATGITSAREYQMLWRHFAYHHDLEDSVDAGDQPLGDDSDLELELEPNPIPTKEALSEASALAKALISGSSREQASGHRINLDPPVLNTQNEKIVRVPSEKQLAQSHCITNVTGPVANSKQLSHIGPSPSHLDPNGASKKRKKPKAWSKEEDADLAAGVQKYGEGNWEDILHRCNFDSTRTPDQLSQRWALKRPGGSTKPASTKHASVGSEERSAALKALSLAVGPMRRTGAYQQSIQHKSTAFAPKMPEVRSAATPSPALALPVPVPVAMPLRVAAQVQTPLHQGQQASVQAAPPKLSNASNKTRKKQAAQPSPTIGPSSIQAAAIAAGGRLATASTAASFLKAAQSKNVVHIKSLGATSLKSSASSKASIVVEHGTQPGGSQHLEPLNPRAVHGVSGVTVVNQSGPPAGARSLETKKALSTTLAPVPCEEDDSEFCVITIDDLFPEDAKEPEVVDVMQPETVDTKAKQPETTGLKAKLPENTDPKAMQQETMDPKSKQPDTLEVEIVDPKDKDMLEFDQYVASQGGHLNTDELNKSKCTDSASQAQGLVGSQKKPQNLIPADGKGNPVTVVGKVKPVTAGVAATGKKTKIPVSHSAAGTPRGIVDTVNANAPNKTLVRRAATPVPACCQASPLKHAMNTKGNQMTTSNATVFSCGVPASSQTSKVAEGASKANPPSSSSQAKPNGVAVNGANKVVNPPSINQASAAVNNTNRAAIPLSSSQASPTIDGANRVANPPPSNQASTAVNGAANKGNPPAAARQ
ncbi:hypothetical protein BDA96_02G336300 [Sorghum bicolor]|uniref:Homeodomain-like superfamily protein n=2 Tax=Sorghum bicolor TaxID=4558 RepID=A0A921UXB0_SORBI|nr:uncharacterized protein LOC8084050 [Sorghum bicolor]EER99457.1 hypothetical protein SORBI_3002G320500 [Sorghum bicolor]KAG0545141.1 hypothetical protein BDA96_02G336300 [Sorghum bicolor]|eukprot:XP_002462936.1 uncharacterized protein LOC8084050 [Sorghum bicolor]